MCIVSETRYTSITAIYAIISYVFFNIFTRIARFFICSAVLFASLEIVNSSAV